MPTLESLVLLTGVACLLLHELDAIHQAEWRFFFTWTGMSDERAYRLFTALHLPLFVLILANLASPAFQIGLDSFMIGHAVAHLLLRRHPLIRFRSPFSWLWIGGAGLLGGLHLLLLAVG